MSVSNQPSILKFTNPNEADTRVAMVYKCKMTNDQLKPTRDPEVKYCASCNQNVFRVNDFDGIESMVASRGCVWGVNAIGPIQQEPKQHFFGIPAIGYELQSTLKWED